MRRMAWRFPELFGLHLPKQHPSWSWRFLESHPTPPRFSLLMTWIDDSEKRGHEYRYATFLKAVIPRN
jgi:hypothetical protein